MVPTGATRVFGTAEFGTTYILLLGIILCPSRNHVTWGRGQLLMGGRLRTAARPSETTRLSSASVKSPISAEENQTSKFQKTLFEREGGHRWPLYFMAKSPTRPHEAVRPQSRRARVSAGWGRGEATGPQPAHRMPAMRLALLLQRDKRTFATDFNTDFFVGTHPPAPWSTSPEALRKCLRIPPGSLQPVLPRQPCSASPLFLGWKRPKRIFREQCVFNH